MTTRVLKSVAVAILAVVLGACQPAGTGAGPDGPSATAGALPGTTVADRILAADASAMVLLFDSGRSRDCDTRRIADTRFVGGTSSDWTEVWTVEACGETNDYGVRFTSSPRGGTDIAVSEA